MYLEQNKNVEDTVVFLTRKVFDSDIISPLQFLISKNAQVAFTEKPQIKVNTLKKQKTWISNYLIFIRDQTKLSRVPL